jgi:hypothetical protein
MVGGYSLSNSTAKAHHPAMNAPDIETQLKDIRATLASQQQAIDELKERRVPEGMPWKITLFLAVGVLAVGLYAVYRYYLVIKSITG